MRGSRDDAAVLAQPVLLGYLGRKDYHGYVGLEYRPSGGRPEDSFGWLEEHGRWQSNLP